MPPSSLSELIPLLTLVAVAAVVLRGVWAFWHGRKAGEWPSVTGRMLQARIVQSYLPDDDGTASYVVDVRYRYQVGGRIYEGTRYSFHDTAFSEYGDAIDALKGIAVGFDVPVYYDPERPERAVLRNRPLLGVSRTGP
jgi:hypothetical protein